MAYKAILGLSEIVVGVLLAIPSFDPQATFARLSAEELREDPGDRFVALVGRHLPALLLHHRGLVAVGLIVLGLAKLVAAAAMWEGQEWGGYLLAATVALLLPFDLRQAVVDPTVGHVLLAVANTAALAVLVLLLRNWLPASPDGNGGIGGEAASRFSEIARMRARPVGPAQSSALHDFARRGPPKKPSTGRWIGSDGLLRSDAGREQRRRLAAHHQ